MERKDFILKLIDFNTLLDNLRTNINLLTYNLTSNEKLELLNINFDKLNSDIKEVIQQFEGSKKEGDNKDNEK